MTFMSVQPVQLNSSRLSLSPCLVACVIASATNPPKTTMHASRWKWLFAPACVGEQVPCILWCSVGLEKPQSGFARFGCLLVGLTALGFLSKTWSPGIFKKSVLKSGSLLDMRMSISQYSYLGLSVGSCLLGGKLYIQPTLTCDCH